MIVIGSCNLLGEPVVRGCGVNARTLISVAVSIRVVCPRERVCAAVLVVAECCAALYGNLSRINIIPLLLCDDIPETISNIKGLFNRILKQDQWDWFTVYMYFDYPTIDFCFHTATKLADLRNAILKNDIYVGKRLIDILIKLGLIRYLNNYLHFGSDVNIERKYVYILSRRRRKRTPKNRYDREKY